MDGNKKRKKNKITPKQRFFIDNYLISFNASSAAAKAGYSDKCAKEQGYRLLNTPHVMEAIEKELNEIHARQKRILVRSADAAIKALVDTVEKGRGIAKVTAANSILDRSGHKSVDMFKGEIDSKVKADVNVADVKSTLLSKLLCKFNKGTDSESHSEPE